MSNLSSTTDAITGIAGAALTIGALGMAFNFAGNMLQPPRKKKRTYDYFDYGYTKPKRRKKNDIFGWDYNIEF